jgi:D-alanyl-D-alanine dipeptidase
VATRGGAGRARATGAGALIVLAIVAGAGFAAGPATDPQEQHRGLPEPLAYLRDIDPSIIQDMRYTGPDNFTGAPVPGYVSAECILTRRTAEALAAVQRRLVARQLSLKVYDCYRPLKAVAAFMRWVRSNAGQDATERFHPALPRRRLVSLGYIAAQSGHSRGHTVDLTVVEIPSRGVPPFVPGRTYGACTAQAGVRAPDDSLDMGTGFDCFDPSSHRGARLSAVQAANRKTLADAMTRAGFEGYRREWWHFSYAPGDPGRTFDIDVVPRP